MEKIQVNEERKNEYLELVRSAQNIESAVGGAYCKLNKMVEARKNVDVELKGWWDKVAEEYNLDKSKDYFVDQDGVINVVERPAQTVPEGGQDGGASEAAPQEGDQGTNPEGQAPEGDQETSGPQEDVDNKEGGTVEDLQ